MYHKIGSIILQNIYFNSLFHDNDNICCHPLDLIFTIYKVCAGLSSPKISQYCRVKCLNNEGHVQSKWANMHSFSVA